MSDWTALRTIAAGVAESAPATVVPLPATGPKLEVRLSAGSTTGSPTSVTFAVWRGSGTVIDRIGEFTVVATDIANAQAFVFNFEGASAWVTVESFVGGSAPTVSATIDVRPTAVGEEVAATTVQISGAVTVSGVSTAANQTTANTKLDTLATKLDTLHADLVLVQEPTKGTAITPHDTNAVSFTKGIRVGVGGDITAKRSGDSISALYKNLASGDRLEGSFILVAATGTTATNLVGDGD